MVEVRNIYRGAHELGMPAHCLFGFTAVRKLFDRVGAGRFEKAIIRNIAADICRNERLSCQTRNTFDDVGGRYPLIRGDAGGRFHSKAAHEYAKPPKDGLLD